MFPLTHLYILEKILNNLNSQVVLGSIFPDTILINKLSWEKTHEEIYKFKDYLIKNNKFKDYLFFLIGVFSHSVNPPGIDFYADRLYKDYKEGYCFAKGRLIVKQVILTLKIKPSIGHWKSHNFIEMGIESLIYPFSNNLREKLNLVLKEKKLIKEISKLLGDFYKIDFKIIELGFKEFLNFIDLKGEEKLLAEKYLLQIKQKHQIELDISLNKVIKLIKNSKVIVKKDYEEFIDYCIINIRKSLPVWLKEEKKYEKNFDFSSDNFNIKLFKGGRIK
ncbi:MAG: zinc dependent phospholipase C family protein [Armatimonadetes bacterium]|nr:zinc dependent phospholipase C family protein [Armatimonadota bacterium]